MAEVNGKPVDLKANFLQIYSRLKPELLDDPAFSFTEDSRQWIDRMLDYNVPRRKLNRGISVVESYEVLKGGQLSDDEFFFIVLGCCVEWLQAYFLALDNIMDNSHTRRAQPSWFRLPKVACALLMTGENLDNFVDVKRVLVEMGTYFQVQDDYLDFFGDPKFIGKLFLQENYGKSDPACVTKVKSLYKDLNLQTIFLSTSE